MCASLWVKRGHPPCPHPARRESQRRCPAAPRHPATAVRIPWGGHVWRLGAACHLGGWRQPVKGDCVAAGNYMSSERLIPGQARAAAAPGPNSKA